MRLVHAMPILISLALGAVAAVAAESEAEFKSTIAAAEAANSEAGKLKNQWTTTAQQIAAAKQAAAAGHFEQATSLARLAEGLAKASIAQAKEQEDAWKAGVIR